MESSRRDYLSWGRVHRYPHQVAVPGFADGAEGALAAAIGAGQTVLAYGLGRSYGDSCLNEGQTLIATRGLDRFIAFDPVAGELECEAGVSLGAILELLTSRREDEPRWFLPVTPGTKYVTLGGAIANDVHGKSHHAQGCFGNHVRSLRLLRSDGAVRDCSDVENADLFRATIGGLGLTGLVLSARIALQKVPGFWLDSEDLRYSDLEAFFALSEESATDWQYTVAWVDCMARGRALGRGVFTRSRHSAQRPASVGAPLASRPRVAMPVDLPGFALNRFSVAAFNSLYWRRCARMPKRHLRAIDPVFYPLDAIGHWNRLYGRRGFFQYQCAIPTAAMRACIRTLVDRVAASGEGSFLAVLKVFGDRPSPGLLSFPLPGATLALDFANRGGATLALLDELDCIVRDAGGRLYPAKDGRMSGADFRRGYPRWDQLASLADPAFSSSFWRRVTADAPMERAA